MVYVDQLCKYGWCKFGSNYPSCHLWADDRRELILFANKLGLKRNWLQQHNSYHLWHFDLMSELRYKAIQLGAKPVDNRVAVASWKKIKEQFRHEK